MKEFTINSGSLNNFKCKALTWKIAAALAINSAPKSFGHLMSIKEKGRKESDELFVATLNLFQDFEIPIQSKNT